MPEDVTLDDLLEAVDKESLVRALAESGVEGVRALLHEREPRDAGLQERIRALRERLRRQASRRVGRILEEYDRRMADLESVSTRQSELLAAEVRRLEERLRAARSVDLSRLVDSDLLSEVRSALLVPDASWNRPARRPSLWARLKAFFQRLAAFFARLFGRKRKGAPANARGRPMPIAVLAAEGRSLGSSELGDVLSQLSPSQTQELRSNVERSLARREREVEKEAERKRRDAEAQRRRLEEEREEARRRAERQVEDRIKEAEDRRVDRELQERGLVAEKEGKLSVTYSLVERFARLILEEETRSLPGDVRLSLKGGASTGVYEKARLRQPEEVAHLDIPSSLLAARQQGLRHIEESTSYVFREVTAERVHVVVMFDKSGSMAESDKLTAAKKALLALYVAIRRRYVDAIVDVVAFDNEVRLLDLLELWEAKPGSFTNTGEALHTAHTLLQSSRATRKEVYVITDGLPEAHTDESGRVKSGNLDTAMAYALRRAAELRTVTPLTFSMILLKSEHPEYEKAARLLTRTLGGDLVITDPKRLGVELLVRWAGGQETTRRALPEASAPPTARGPTPGEGARRRRRRADRRMGG